MRPSSPRFIGVTGGAGAGKSELLKYIAGHYPCEVCLADQAAHEVKEPGTLSYYRLVELLGEGILGADGRIDRQAMAGKIFSDRGLLERVNGIIHPAVKEYLLERLERAEREGKARFFFVEAALLLECGYGELVDEMWYVYADEAARRQRLAEERGYSAERIDAVLANQLSEEAFRAGCDFVIDNSGTLEESFAQVDRRLGAYR